MFNVGGGEVLVILLIALIVLGPDKLPDAARQAGKYLGDFRRMSNGFQRELRDAMDLGDLMGTTKPTSAGGPTPQPSAAPAGATSAAESGAPSSPADAPSSNGTDPSPGSPNGATTADATATTNGVATSATSAGATPTVRKRSIEVDGPSSSFG